MVIFFVLWATAFCTRFIFNDSGIYTVAAVFCEIVFKTVVTVCLAIYFIGLISKNKAKNYWHILAALVIGLAIPALSHFADCITYAWFRSGFELDYMLKPGVTMFLAYYDSYDVIWSILGEIAFASGAYALSYAGIKNRWVSKIANRFGYILAEDVATVKTNVISFPEDFDMNSPVISAKENGRLVVASIEVYNSVAGYCADLVELDAADDFDLDIKEILEHAVKTDMLSSKEMIIPEEMRKDIVSEEYEVIRYGNWWELVPFYIAGK